MKYENLLDAIGDTPIVRLNRLTRHLQCSLYAKLEFMNPGGSVKDRIAKYMTLGAEKCGAIAAGGTFIECTSGNTGMGLVLFACARVDGVRFNPDAQYTNSRDVQQLLSARTVYTFNCDKNSLVHAVSPEWSDDSHLCG